MSGVAREVPVHTVHVPPLCHEEEDGPGDDPEESEVEYPADPAGTPFVDERGRVDVDCFFVDAEGYVGPATVVSGADQAFDVGFDVNFIDAVHRTVDPEDLQPGRRGAVVLAPVLQRPLRLVCELYTRLVARSLGLAPTAAVRRVPVFDCAFIPEEWIVCLAQVLLEAERDVEIHDPLLLFLVLAPDSFVVPSLDPNDGMRCYSAHVARDIGIQLVRVGQALVHADRDRALVRGFAVGQISAFWVFDNIVGLDQRSASGLGAILLRCGGRARGCLAVGRKVFRRGFRIFVVVGSCVHRHCVGVVFVGRWCWFAHVACRLLPAAWYRVRLCGAGERCADNDGSG